jgi:hypothetical protein
MILHLALEIDGIIRDVRLTPTGGRIEVRVTSRCRRGKEAAGGFDQPVLLNGVVAELLARKLLGRPLVPPLLTRFFTMLSHQDL